MSEREFDFCIVGAGILGAAVAASIRDLGSICILEKNDRPCQETSGNNSGVIHPGFNHAPDSLKGILCVEGNALLYEYCAIRKIPTRQCGTFVLGFSIQDEFSLQKLRENAKDLGVEVQEQMPPEPIHPTLRAAFFAPSGGVVDVAALCESLISESDASVQCNHEVQRIEYVPGVWRIQSSQGEFHANFLINAAGLYADEISKMAGYPDYTIYPSAGEYYEIESWSVPHLYYPAPYSATALGIHLTPTLRGTTLVGPTARYLQSKTDPERFFKEEDFVTAAEFLYPGCAQNPGKLAHRGIRPKLSKTGFQDFVIRKEEKPLIQLVGIESPGLTSCLAIAKRVRNLITK